MVAVHDGVSERLELIAVQLAVETRACVASVRERDLAALVDGAGGGDPEQDALELEPTRERCAHRLVWLNPLKAHAGYEPLTRGMQAALPYVDHFLAGNSIASLEELAELLEGEMS